MISKVSKNTIKLFETFYNYLNGRTISQVENRGYDFAKVIKFLSNKVDCIFLLFDANKLDISDEYKQVPEVFHFKNISMYLTACYGDEAI